MKLSQKEPNVLIGTAFSFVVAAVMLLLFHIPPPQCLRALLLLLGLTGAIRMGPSASPATLAEAVVQTAEGIDAQKAGPPGSVTSEAVPVLTDVVASVLGKPKQEATSLVDSVLGPRRPREPRG